MEVPQALAKAVDLMFAVLDPGSFPPVFRVKRGPRPAILPAGEDRQAGIQAAWLKSILTQPFWLARVAGCLIIFWSSWRVQSLVQRNVDIIASNTSMRSPANCPAGLSASRTENAIISQSPAVPGTGST